MSDDKDLLTKLHERFDSVTRALHTVNNTMMSLWDAIDRLIEELKDARKK